MADRIPARWKRGLAAISRRKYGRAILFSAPVVLGFAVLLTQVAGRGSPVHNASTERAQAVRTIVVAPMVLRPRAAGFGFVQPATLWQGVAQVNGRIVEKNPLAMRGNLVPEGEVLFRIDRTDYVLALDRARANLASVKAQLAQLAVEEKSLASLLEIERQSLALLTRDVKRQRTLAKRGSASAARADEALRAQLNQRLKVVDMTNKTTQMVSRREELEALVALRQAESEQAQLDLDRTVMRMPFTGRIASIKAEESRYVRVGEELITADSIDRAEILVQIPYSRFRPLVPSHLNLDLSDDQLSNIIARLGFKATVRFPHADVPGSWEARVDRLSEQVDPETRSLGIIVVVDEPFRKAIPGKRPPLSKNLFVRVEIEAPATHDRLIVPVAALHRGTDGEDMVFVAGLDNRLKRRRVDVESHLGELAVIAAGLKPNERVVVSDLLPAVEGMLLATRRDKAMERRIVAEAAGESPLP